MRWGGFIREETDMMPYEQAVAIARTMREHGMPIPDEIARILAGREANEDESGASIYARLRAISRFPPSEEKRRCIESAVDQLLADVPNALEPGLLLGKVQCGKTDTFENIIALAFDRGVDIAIIFTKGTNTLAQQTLMRMKSDFKPFQKGDLISNTPNIEVFDIMREIRNGLPPSKIKGAKTIIVCKKQADNLSHLYDLFSRSSRHLLEKRVIIVDDEADFASRNYIAATDGKESGLALAKIPEQIDEFRKLTNARYLQVTATPYSLYLQPGGEINLLNGKARGFKPRFSSLVPVHDKYIGGNEYFVEAADPDSMYSHLFNQVTEKCIHVLGKRDGRYLSSCTSSNNIYPLTRALLAYFIATAIRLIQSRAAGRHYQSSALIHVDINKKQHDWQKELIEALVEDIKKFAAKGFADSKILAPLYSELVADFATSIGKGAASGLPAGEMPPSEAIIAELKRLFAETDYLVKVVNSDNDVSGMLNEWGELRLDAAANIFIGGSILDRGVTLRNMLLFFYGRDPKVSQQDTVMQHSRMYGARDKEDMAVTRFYTTRDIHDLLTRMHELDENLREQVALGNAGADFCVNFVGIDDKIRPCASSKIRVADTQVFKRQQRILPVGFFTGSRKETERPVAKIDAIINACKANVDADGFFPMDKSQALEIIKLVRETCVYGEEWGNLARKDDLRRLEASLVNCLDKSGDGKVYTLFRANRNSGRRSPTDGSFRNSPDHGGTELAQARKKALDNPVLMLFRENGLKNMAEVPWSTKKENLGWNGAPFYWPVLLTQTNIDSAFYVLDEKQNPSSPQRLELTLPDGIDPDEVLQAGWDADLLTTFGVPGTEYEKDRFFGAPLRETTAAKYVLKDDKSGQFVPVPEVAEKGGAGLGVYDFNDNLFPYELREYKYLLLTHGGHYMLLELAPMDEWEMEARLILDANGDLRDVDNPDLILVHASDIIKSHEDLSEHVEINKSVCQWLINYKLKGVLDYDWEWI